VSEEEVKTRQSAVGAEEGTLRVLRD
jgi:hypothetical protein